MYKLLIAIGLLIVFSCGEPEESMEVCGEIIDKGTFLLSEEGLSMVPVSYLTTADGLVFENENGDTLHLDYTGKTRQRLEQISKKACGNNQTNSYLYEMEALNLGFGSEGYNFQISLRTSLRQLFSNLGDTTSIFQLSYDTCYTETISWSFGFRENDETISSNYMQKTISRSPCEDFLTPTFFDNIDFFELLDFKNHTFKNVYTNNKPIQSNNLYLRFFYSQEDGLVGFEDRHNILWTLKE